MNVDFLMIRMYLIRANSQKQSQTFQRMWISTFLVSITWIFGHCLKSIDQT